MIDIFATILHFCASCANAGNTIPGPVGVLGGTAGTAGGLGGVGDSGSGDAGTDEDDPELERELDRLYPPSLMARLLPPRGPTLGPPVMVGGPRTFSEVALVLGALSGAGALAEGEAVEKVFDDLLRDKVVEEGLKSKVDDLLSDKVVEDGLKSAGEGLDQLVEAGPAQEPEQVMGSTILVANDDGTFTTIYPDGCSSTPNADGSVTTEHPDAPSTTSPPTATPATGVFYDGTDATGTSGSSDPDDP